MVRLAWTEPDPAARRRSLRVLLGSVPIVSCFHAICFLLDGILFPELWKTRVRTPVFVLGHARSGTTFLHRLMSQDEGRFSSFLLYELYFPSLLQKKAIRWLAALDRHVLSGWMAARVRAWEEKRYTAVRQAHEMGLTQPEEDDLVFYYSCASGFWITRMPYLGDLDFYSVDRWPARKRRRLMRFYEACVRRQLHLNGSHKIHLSKNPIFAGRVESLIETFPDARIVVPLRNPLETIPSLLKLVSGSWRGQDWAPERVRRSLRVLAEQSFHTYRHPLEVLDRHPEIAHAMVDYRQLEADPATTFEQVYRELGFRITPEYRARLRAAGTRARQHVSSHAYSLEEFGLDADEIRTRLGDLFERHGWDPGLTEPGSS
jgi:hypothetical protein